MPETEKQSTARRIIKILGELGAAITTVIIIIQFFGPSITVFRPNALEIYRGETVTITWEVSGDPTEVLLNGKRVGSAGDDTTEPLAADRTFILVARKPFALWNGFELWERRVESRPIRIRVIPPRVQAKIEAYPDRVKPGDQVKISWLSMNAEKVEIEPLVLIGSVKPGEGSRVISIQDTTVFKITASSSGTEPATAERTVEVLRTQLEFWPEPGQIHKGQAVKLKWQTNAQLIEISPGVGSFREISGEREVFPTENTTYEAVVDGPGGLERKGVSVVVLPPLPATLTAWAERPRITIGEGTVVRWQATNADRVRLEGPGINQDFPLEAYYTFRPTTQGVFELKITAKGLEGQSEALVQVEVMPPPRPTLRAWVERPKITLGETTIVRWQPQNADRVMVQGPDINQEFASTGYFEFSPSQKGLLQLRLTATGAGGRSEPTIVQFEVLPPPLPKIAVLNAQVPNQLRAAANNLTQAVKDHLTKQGYTVVTAPPGAPEIDRFPDWVRSLSSRRPPYEIPDFVVEARLELQEEQGQSVGTGIRGVIGDILKQKTGLESGEYIDLVSTSRATIRVMRLPSGQEMQASHSQLVRESQAVNVRGTDRDSVQARLTGIAAGKAINQALSNLTMP